MPLKSASHKFEFYDVAAGKKVAIDLKKDKAKLHLCRFPGTDKRQIKYASDGKKMAQFIDANTYESLKQTYGLKTKTKCTSSSKKKTKSKAKKTAAGR